uniref:Uncharacterized protein n=1 Tax=Strongyloides stercoralis TaxID=6248 RepID=A0A0K0EPY1_STRER
VLEVFNKS